MNIIKNLDFLSIIHFLIYFFIGLYWKGHYEIIFIIGVLWEIFEYYMVNNKKTKQLLYKLWPIPEKYWYDSFEHSIIDIAINMLGYYVGNQLP